MAGSSLQVKICLVVYKYTRVLLLLTGCMYLLYEELLKMSFLLYFVFN